MAKLNLSQEGMSFSLELSANVLTEYLKQDVKDLDILQKMALITKLRNQLSKGKQKSNNNRRGGSIESVSGGGNLQRILHPTVEGNDRIGKNSIDYQNVRVYKSSSNKQIAIEPDLILIALDLIEMIFDEGDINFSDYSTQMIEGIGEEVKPLLKGYYELARYTPGMEGVDKMSTPDEVAEFNIDKFNSTEYLSNKNKPKTIITTLALKPSIKMRAIQTDWAETSLWKAAELSPNLLRKWAEEKPIDLLALIEGKIVKATRWKEVAMFNGADESGAHELMIDMLAPFSPAMESNQIPITEKEMEAIQNKLLALIKK